MIYLGVNNAVRKASLVCAGLSGASRLVYDGWCGVNGARRQFLGGKVTADMIERFELVPAYLSVRTMDSNGSLGSAAGSTALKSAADLNTYSQYGTVTVDTNSRTITIKETATGYFIQMSPEIYVKLKNGYRTDLWSGNISKMDDLKFTVYCYYSITGSGSWGMRMLTFCGTDDVNPDSSAASASKTTTMTPVSSECYVGAGNARGSGTMTVQLTVQSFTVGGVSVPISIVYDS